MMKNNELRPIKEIHEIREQIFEETKIFLHKKERIDKQNRQRHSRKIWIKDSSEGIKCTF